jgi:hypothetical protein
VGNSVERKRDKTERRGDSKDKNGREENGLKAWTAGLHACICIMYQEKHCTGTILGVFTGNESFPGWIFRNSYYLEDIFFNISFSLVYGEFTYIFSHHTKET